MKKEGVKLSLPIPCRHIEEAEEQLVTLSLGTIWRWEVHFTS